MPARLLRALQSVTDVVQAADSARQGADSLQQAMDSLQAVQDSVEEARDTTDAIAELGEGVSEAGRLAAEGRWEELWAGLKDSAVTAAENLVPDILSAAFVFLVFFALYLLLFAVLRRLLRDSKRVGPGGRELTLRTFRVIGLTFIAILALSQLGLNVSALVAGLGIAGLAVGFAAKDSLENYIAGVSILLDRPFRVGQWVQAGDVYGRVAELTLRSTRLHTLNREEVVIPNVQMVNQPLVNKSTIGSLRVDVDFGVAYKEDIDRVRGVVMELVEGDDRLATEPGPRVVVTGLGDSSVDFQLQLFLVDPGNAVPVRFEYTERIRKALAAAGIEIPFPHLQLFVDGAEGLRGVWGPRTERGDGEAPAADEGIDPHHGAKGPAPETDGAEAPAAEAPGREVATPRGPPPPLPQGQTAADRDESGDG